MRKTILLALMGTLVLGAASAQAQMDLIFGNFAQVGVIDPGTGALSDVYELSGDSTELFGLATQPGTNTIYGIGDSARVIATVDPDTGITTQVAALSSGGVGFGDGDSTWASALTFDSGGTLWGIVGFDGGDALPGGAIFTVDLGTGEATDSGIAPVGAGGQAIEYNPDDGLVYHFYNDSIGGGGSAFLRTINPVSGAIADVALSGDDFNAVNGLAYAGDGLFYAYDRGPDRLVSITTDGVATVLQTETGANALSLTMSEYVPEPCTALLLGFGLFAAVRRR